MIMGIFDRLFKKKAKTPLDEEFITPSEIELPRDFEDMDLGGGYETPKFLDIPSDLDMKSKIFYDFDKLEYRLKLQNKTTDMIGDIDIHLKTGKDSVVNPVNSKLVVEMLEPGKSINLTFKLKPKYKLGKSSMYGKIEYFDFKSKERKIFRLPQAYVDFEFNELQSDRINEDKWRLICSGLRNYEVETDMLEEPPEKIFEIFKNALSNFGLFMLPPIENINLYRGIARFYGFDNDENRYAVEVQVIGDKKKSKVLFRIWSNEPRTGMAIAFKTLDIIDDATKIKKFIVEK